MTKLALRRVYVFSIVAAGVIEPELAVQRAGMFELAVRASGSLVRMAALMAGFASVVRCIAFLELSGVLRRVDMLNAGC